MDFRWNGVWTDDEDLQEFLSTKQMQGGDWESTQTVAPEGVEAAAIAKVFCTPSTLVSTA